MSSFPLYDTFARVAAATAANAANKGKPDPLTAEQKRKILEDIKLLDQDGLDNLYLIIRYAAHRDNDDTVFSAKYQKKGVVFNLDSFSDELQRIIKAFVDKHLEETLATQGPIEIILQ